MLTITVHNKQGASDKAQRATRAQINAWLDGWDDPQNLTVVVRDAAGVDIASKPLGRRTLIWVNHAHR